MAITVPVAAALREASVRLAEAGVAAARTDAELLAAHLLGVPRGRLALAAGLGPEQLAALRALVARRAQRVPLQHLTGVVGFCRLELAVGPGGFVPRPETELLAQWAVSVARTLPPPVTVVDLGSGTGALALVIAQEVPGEPRVYAVESDPAARAWLERNAAARVRAGDPPVTVVSGDLTDPAVLPALTGAVDLVVSNPPYVPVGAPVPPEVADHDPPGAVFGGPDGLAVIRPLVATAAALLRDGGWLSIEHDECHGDVVPQLLAGRYVDIADHLDLTGRPRYVTARRVAD